VLAEPIEALCGQLIVGGFDGPSVPAWLSQALARGRRGGVVLFRRNLPDLAGTHRLCSALWTASSDGMAPLIGVDQEGGRVTRLPSPFLRLPAMRVLGALDDPGLTRRAATAVGHELAAVGITCDLAPVLDVDSNPDNPVIGDRSFGATTELVMRHGLAFAAGLSAAGVAATGKHFPGHGDTTVDSHVDLPILNHDRARLERVELAPFRAATRASLPALMSAHVVATALDPTLPATLSRAVCTNLLRGELGYRGVLFSDDIEMGAVAGRHPVEDIAVGAVEAGCDALVIGRSEEQQERAHEALVRHALSSPAFLERCREAGVRLRHLRSACKGRRCEQLADVQAIVGGTASLELANEIERRVSGGRTA
jgi:beta-N-acetylhexosaminidase